MEVLATRLGYMKLEDVLAILKTRDNFSLYYTNKKTVILVKNVNSNNLYLSYPKYDRLPYKLVAGKNITNGKKIFDSTTDSIDKMDISKWNNGNQIMAYEHYNIW